MKVWSGNTVPIYIILCLVTLARSSPVQLEVFTEALCPDTKRFFSTTFVRAFTSLPDEVMNVTIVPYGHATQRWSRRHNAWLFRCQHGPAECFGNALQACAVRLYPEQRHHMPFILCMFEDRHWRRIGRTAHKCARTQSVGGTISYQALLTCARGAQGNQIMHEMGERTGRKPFIPWIEVNGKSSWRVQRAGWLDLTHVICYEYDGSDKPAICRQYEQT